MIPSLIFQPFQIRLTKNPKETKIERNFRKICSELLHLFSWAAFFMSDLPSPPVHPLYKIIVSFEDTENCG